MSAPASSQRGQHMQRIVTPHHGGIDIEPGMPPASVLGASHAGSRTLAHGGANAAAHGCQVGQAVITWADGSQSVIPVVRPTAPSPSSHSILSVASDADAAAASAAAAGCTLGLATG